MTDPIAPTPPPSASLIAKASLLTGRAIDRPFEVPGQMTESAYVAGGVAHGLVGRLTGAVLDGVSALQPRGFIEKLIGTTSERLDATLAHNQTRAETSKNIFWDPVSTGAHQIGQAFANPFSLFYAKRAGFEIPTEPEQLRDMLANQITDPDPHVRFPTPPPPAEPEPTPEPTPEEPGTPTPTPEDPGTPTPTPEEPGTPTPTPEEPGTPTPTPEDPGTTPTPDGETKPDGEAPVTPGDGETKPDGETLPQTAPTDGSGEAGTTTPPGDDTTKPDGEAPVTPDDTTKPGDVASTDDAATSDAGDAPDDAKGSGAGGGAAAPKVVPEDDVKTQTLGLQPHPTDPIEQAPVEGAPSTGPIIQSDDASNVVSAAIDAVDAPQRPATPPATDEAAPVASSPSAAAASLDAEAGARAVAPPILDEPVAATAPAPRTAPAPAAPPMRTR